MSLCVRERREERGRKSESAHSKLEASNSLGFRHSHFSQPQQQPLLGGPNGPSSLHPGGLLRTCLSFDHSQSTGPVMFTHVHYIRSRGSRSQVPWARLLSFLRTASRAAAAAIASVGCYTSPLGATLLHSCKPSQAKPSPTQLILTTHTHTTLKHVLAAT